MTREDIIRMAREACDTDKVDAWRNGFWTITQEELERFAALIKDQMIRDGWRQCAEGQKTTQFCALAEDAKEIRARGNNAS